MSAIGTKRTSLRNDDVHEVRVLALDGLRASAAFVAVHEVIYAVVRRMKDIRRASGHLEEQAILPPCRRNLAPCWGQVQAVPHRREWLTSQAMTPLGLNDQQLKTVLDVAGFVPRRLRRKFLKDIAAQLSVVPGTKKILSTLRDSDVERAIGDVLVNLDRVERPRSDQWDMRSNPLASA